MTSARRWLVRALPVAMMVGVVGLSGLVGVGTAGASPGRMPVFAPGSAPQRPMEVLQELTMEVGGEVSRAVALEQMRKMAREVGADAVLDVVVTDGRHDMPLYQMAAMPVVLLGSLVSLMAWTPDPVADAVAAARRPPVQRKVKVVTGVAVKYVR